MKLSISRSEIHIWKIDLDTIRYKPKTFLFLLSAEEIARCDQFVSQSNHYRYQVTHCMKRLILASYLDNDPQCLHFKLGKWGKPAIANQNALSLQFNISHSHNLILIAITAKDAVGLDVEYQAKKIPIESLAKLIFSPAEKISFSALKSQEEKEKAFFRSWTRKEAYLKAKGVGLMMEELSNIFVDMSEFPSNEWIKVSPLEKISWKLFPLHAGESYTASVVATAHQKNLFTYDANQLEI